MREKGSGFKQARAAPQNAPHVTDAYHQQFKKDTWESGQSPELLVNLNRTGEDHSPRLP